MSSECLVINEWLLHDLRGDNGQEAQKESYDFLIKLKEKCDRIIILRNSPWRKKANELMKCSNPPVRQLSKYLHGVILRDSKKSRFLDENEVKTIPENVKKLVPQDDLYLFEAYYSADAKIIVTTDQKLYQSTTQNVNIRLKDDFLKEYLGL